MKYHHILLSDVIAIVTGSLAYTAATSVRRLRQYGESGDILDRLLDSASFIGAGSLPFLAATLIILMVCRKKQFGRKRISMIMITSSIIMGSIMLLFLIPIVLDNGIDTEGLATLITPLSAVLSMRYFALRGSERPWPGRPFGFLEV